MDSVDAAAQVRIDHQPTVRQLLGHEPLLIQGRGGRFLSHQKQRRSFDLLEYKSQWYLRQFVPVPAHHTSQQCSACGSVDAGNRVSQSLFRCLSCGHETNADVNAAENIRRLGVETQANAAENIRRLGVETQARAGNISLGVPPETLVLQRRVMW